MYISNKDHISYYQYHPSTYYHGAKFVMSDIAAVSDIMSADDTIQREKGRALPSYSFLRVLETEKSKTEHKHGQLLGEGPLPNSQMAITLLCHHSGEGGLWSLPLPTSLQIPSQSLTHLNLIISPKAPPPSTTILWVRASTYDFWGQGAQKHSP